MYIASAATRPTPPRGDSPLRFFAAARLFPLQVFVLELQDDEVLVLIDAVLFDHLVKTLLHLRLRADVIRRLFGDDVVDMVLFGLPRDPFFPLARRTAISGSFHRLFPFLTPVV